MSFAHDFGHDIPPDDWDGNYRRKSKRTYHYSPPITRYIMLKITLVYETVKAYLVNDGKGNRWIPKSQSQLLNDNSVIKIPEWLEDNKEYVN